MSPVDHSKTDADQRIRIKRLWMTVGSYGFTFSLATFCALLGFLDWIHVGVFVLMTLAINGLFYQAFRRDWNLRWRDPNLTAEQMLLSLIPAYWVMFFLSDIQARTAFLPIAIVPLLYGMLGLDTRRFLIIGLLNFAGYVALIGLLLWLRPEVIHYRSELVALFALAAVMAQLALIGGYIVNLRNKLRDRNEELNVALQRISDMANRDELTGVNNRRFLLSAIEQEYQRCQRGADAFSVCLLDIDYFKRINDTYGHLVGDEVLKLVADTVRQQVRIIDCFGRYGGEEFLLIMPQTSISGAMIKAERLRQAIENITVPEFGAGAQVTVSIGVAQFRNDESLRQTIQRADEALYAAKAGGRNRVVNGDEALAADQP